MSVFTTENFHRYFISSDPNNNSTNTATSPVNVNTRIDKSKKELLAIGSNVSNKLLDLEARFENFKNNFSSSNIEQIATVTSNIQNVDNIDKILSVNEDIDELDNAYNELYTDFSTYKNSLSNVEIDVKNLKMNNSNVELFKDEIISHSNDINALKNTVGSHSNSISDLQNFDNLIIMDAKDAVDKNDFLERLYNRFVS